MEATFSLEDEQNKIGRKRICLHQEDKVSNVMKEEKIRIVEILRNAGENNF